MIRKTDSGQTDERASDLRHARTRTTLDGKTWARYSISVWNDINKTVPERRLHHPASFPLALPRRLIEIFSREGDLVLDPFAGTGSTLVAAVELGRKAVGLEIDPSFTAIAGSRLDGEHREDARLINASALELDRHLKPESVSLCITSPPYWDILSRKRTADHRDGRDYPKPVGDLSTVASYDGFVTVLGEVFSRVLNCLRPRGYCIVNVMDLRKRDTFYPLHMDLTLELQRQGFTLDDIVIWDRRADYNSLRPLGYPYVFRVNKIHEYLLIFQKR